MAARPLTIACGDYDRTRPLIDGTVKPDGLELNWLVLPHQEMWTRMLDRYEFDASELSLANYLIARTTGKPLIAIPIFPARAFRHAYVFVNTRSGIREPRDLAGKRVGLAEFPQTATVWVRGILQHDYEVPLREIRWVTWTRTRVEVDLAGYRVEEVPEGNEPVKMLIEGDLDAMIIPFVPPAFLGAAQVKRLFENYREVEVAYFKRSGIFPIMHTVVMREELWREVPWIAPSLFNAFQEAKRVAYGNLDNPSPYKISLAWARETFAEQKTLLGPDPWAYGLAKNRHVLETLVGYLYEQGLVRKRLPIEEFFAPNTREL
jgi:4,5-dihydroxyphthalate decarboxylase